jgi:hypothetical protein
MNWDERIVLPLPRFDLIPALEADHPPARRTAGYSDSTLSDSAEPALVKLTANPTLGLILGWITEFMVRRPVPERPSDDASNPRIGVCAVRGPLRCLCWPTISPRHIGSTVDRPQYGDDLGFRVGVFHGRP